MVKCEIIIANMYVRTYASWACMSTPLPGERVRVEFGSMRVVKARISENICGCDHNKIRQFPLIQNL